MQIHELTAKHLDEGIMDVYNKAKGAVTGAVQGWQQSKKDRATADALKAVSDRSIKVWQQYAKNLKNITPDPARYVTLYKQALTAFVQKNLLKDQPIASAINKAEINQLIDSISAAEANPQQVAQLFPKLVQQAALSSPTVSTNSDELPDTAATPAATATPQADTGYTVPAGKRIRVQHIASGAEQPSFYYKKSDGTWENQLGQAVQQSAYAYLEKLISASKGARIENDPDAPVEAPTASKGSKKRRRAPK